MSKVEAYSCIRESLNFLRRRGRWEFFNGLVTLALLRGTL